MKLKWEKDTDDVDWSLWLGPVCVGAVADRGSNIVAWFGHEHMSYTEGPFENMAHAKGWVKRKAETWLSSIVRTHSEK